MNPIGIMQGRLLPPVGGRIQSFPTEDWRKEFSLAQKAGLDRIEWIYEQDTDTANPLGTDAGVAEMRQVARESGVVVQSVCADYYMYDLLVTPDGDGSQATLDHLIWLIEQASLLGARYVVLPFVDSSSLKSTRQVQGLARVLKSVLPVAERVSVQLHLETDLPATTLVSLLEKEVKSPLVRITYDIGNEAALGHNPGEDLPLLTPWLGSVHVKDRVLNGSTVPLGSGSADFDTCFRVLATGRYAGPFILQVARGDSGDEVNLAHRNRTFVENHWEAALQSVPG